MFTINCVLLYYRYLPARLLCNDFVHLHTLWRPYFPILPALYYNLVDSSVAPINTTADDSTLLSRFRRDELSTTQPHYWFS